ncbi:MAG TPA: Crp/Fnr family transcriptional regulator [Solirubrobacteraceae bacterium]|nr:Crp/Fnr family transcriptional regulator [Solirubrobacteraceae bacterium]
MTKYQKALLEQSATCYVLREDPQLADGIPAGRRDRAEDDCIARKLTVRRGRWSSQPRGPVGDGIGLLVLEGLLLRRIAVGGRFGAELLGPGDLVRPADTAYVEPMLRQATAWQALEFAQLAVLDGSVTKSLARYPEVIERLVARTTERSRRLLVNMAIVHHPRVDVRLQMAFWHLADRWGRIDGGQVLLPLRLTHSVLADLIAARRPSVSKALSDLARRGILSRVEAGWLLASEPPRVLPENADDCKTTDEPALGRRI